MSTRAALYFRQSLDVQEGIERQRERCRSLADARGWQVVAEYSDNDTSASKPRGPQTGWGRMLDGIGRDFDVIVAVDLDRLLRSTTDLVELTTRGGRVVTVDGEIDLTTADGEFRATMLAGIARFEVRRKSERQRRANEARARAGRWVGGRRPFGFEADGVNVREDEAAAVRRGFDAFVAGVPLGAIAREWNAAGFTTGQGGEWKHFNVRQVLANPRYVGQVRYRGEVVGTAQWPALIEESTWLAVQAILGNPARQTGARQGRNLLTGIARCAVCGSHLHAGGNARKGVRAYRCSGALGHVARMAQPVEDYVVGNVIARLSKPDARSLMHRDDVDTTALQTEADGLRARLDALAVQFADGQLTSSQLRAGTERLRSKLSEVEAKLADSARVDVFGDLVGVEDVRAVWEGLDLARKRLVIDALMVVHVHAPGRGTRTFRPESVTIEWR